METSLYEKLGGKDTIGKVVEEFYKRIMEDESVNHFFRDTDMAKQLRHQTAFISYALGGAPYTGRSMAAAHTGLNLQPEHFNSIVNHLKDSLAQFGVTGDDIREITEKVESLRGDILYK
ncbi:group 1 truncated hemoglobin [Paenibacillus chitinolyticus]|uniref:group I truncated hemoglobin n=1 Tax=Paenibacillus chitinolyticus TaxID=79263 RepID=UPI0038653A3C